MNWFRRTCLVLMLSGVVIAHAHAHAFLAHAEPAVGGEVKQTPHAVRILFTEPIQPALSTIKVFDGMERQIDKKDTRSDGGNKALLQVSLPALGPGTYRVKWRVVSADGHSTTGRFTFRIVP